VTGDSRSSGALVGRNLVPVLVGLLVAAIIGGIVGGLIVHATTDSGSGSSASAGSSGSSCSAQDVADKALPSVVTVRAVGGQQGGSGSGVVLRQGGYILTNNHVISVAANGGHLSIVRSDGESTDATIVGRDPLTDLAVLKAQDTSNLPVIQQGDSGSLQVGQPVIALGSPLGLTSTVTAGIVSALNRYVRVPAEQGQTAHLVGAIQTDASINPGNSGGALVDCDARLVGINTAGAALPNTPGGSIGLGFAIPVDFAVGVAGELIDQGSVTRPGFGMQVQPITGGLFVEAVAASGPADKAGLRPGDVIVEVDGEPAQNIDPLVVKTLQMNAGDTVEITYERQGVRHTTDLTLSAG
jgi:putative serine protease PepD